MRPLADKGNVSEQNEQQQGGPQLPTDGLLGMPEKIADLETAIQTLGAENVGAFIAEPVLASGGVIIPPEGYHKRCLEVCRRHDVLYISD